MSTKFIYQMTLIWILALGYLACTNHIDPYVRKKELYPGDQSAEYQDLGNVVTNIWEKDKRAKSRQYCEEMLPDKLVLHIYNKADTLQMYRAFRYSNPKYTQVNGFVAYAKPYFFMYLCNECGVALERIYVWEMIRALAMCNINLTHDKYDDMPEWLFRGDDSIYKESLRRLGL